MIGAEARVVRELRGPPSLAGIVVAVREDEDTAGSAQKIAGGLSAEGARLYDLDDANAATTIEAINAEPRMAHVAAVRGRLREETWRRLDRARTRIGRRLALVVSPASRRDLARYAPQIASVAAPEITIPTRVRVVAYPMHEHESYALQQVGGPHLRVVGDELFEGSLTPEEVETLRARNIVVDVFDGDATPWLSPDRELVDLPPAPGPASYLVAMDLPTRLALSHEPIDGIELVEAHGSRLRVEAKTFDAFEALRGRPGVGAIEAFDAPMPRSAPGPERAWTVLLHDPATRDAVRSRAEASAHVVKADGAALRIIATEEAVAAIRAWPEVRRVDAYATPTLSADVFRAQIGITPAAMTATSWDGSGEIIAVADSGIDRAHPALESRIVGLLPYTNEGAGEDPIGHGTHVAGILVGDDPDFPHLRGVAPGARLIVQRIVDDGGALSGLPADLGTLLQDAYDRGARIHNDSWGAEVEGRYDAQAEQIDAFVAAHPDMLVVLAAGNRGSAAKPRDGDQTAETGFVEYGSLDAPAVAKNAIAVGACRSARSEGGRADESWRDRWPALFADDPIGAQRIAGDGECMAAFSSRGPVEGSRIKPDLLAPGTAIASTWPVGHDGATSWGLVPGTQKRYRYLGGTSMAAPIVAGGAALIRQYLRIARGHATPSASLLKALLVQGTRPLTGDDAVHRCGAPNFHQGFGCIDLRLCIPSSGAWRLAFEDSLGTSGRALAFDGAKFRARVDVTVAGPLRVAVAWIDPPPAGRQNHLQLLVEMPDGTKRRGNEARQGRIPERPTDEVNNVLMVRIGGAPPGRYTVQVQATKLLRQPQHFALVVAGPLADDLLH